MDFFLIVCLYDERKEKIILDIYIGLMSFFKIGFIVPMNL